MKHISLLAIALSITSCSFAVVPVDPASIADCIKERVNNHINPIQQEILDELITKDLTLRKKEVEAYQTTKANIKNDTAEQLKKLREVYNEEKKVHATDFSSIKKSLRAAKKASLQPAKSLDELLTQAASYVDMLTQQAKSLKNEIFLKSLKTEEDWLSKLKKSITHSGISLDVSIPKQTRKDRAQKSS